MTRIPIEEKVFLHQFCHLNVLAGLVAAKSFSFEDIAFQGGTSLRLAWGSPRFSEDLDFLISMDRSKDLDQLVSFAAKNLHESLKSKGFEGEIELLKPKNREKNAVKGYWINFIDCCALAP